MAYMVDKNARSSRPARWAVSLCLVLSLLSPAHSAGKIQAVHLKEINVLRSAAGLSAVTLPQLKGLEKAIGPGAFPLARAGAAAAALVKFQAAQNDPEALGELARKIGGYDKLTSIQKQAQGIAAQWWISSRSSNDHPAFGSLTNLIQALGGDRAPKAPEDISRVLSSLDSYFTHSAPGGVSAQNPEVRADPARKVPTRLSKADTIGTSPAEAMVNAVMARSGVMPRLTGRLESSAVLAHGGAAGKAPDQLMPRVARYLTPYLELRAEQNGYESLASYARWALSADGSAEKDLLEAQIKMLPGHYAEDWSAFFRQSFMWSKALDGYLDRLVAQRMKEGDRSLRVRTFGIGHGQEPYSLAIAADRALRRAGENPGLWRVSIEAFDVNIVSLMAAEEGVFTELQLRGVPDSYRTPAYESLFEAGPTPHTVRMSAMLRSWVEPIYLNLNDLGQHSVLTRTAADIAFANHVLIHLNLEPSQRLAEYLLQGDWGTPGSPMFLSLSEILVTELAPKGKSRSGKVPVLEHADPINVARQGPYEQLVENFPDRLRYGLANQRAFALKSLAQSLAAVKGWMSFHAPREAFEIWRLYRDYRAKLTRNPAYEGVVDPALVGVLARFSTLGIDVELIADDRPYAWDRAGRKLGLNVAWFLESKEAPKRDLLLEGLRSRILSELGGADRKSPWVPFRPFFHPRHGEGGILASGVTPEGAVLKLVRFDEQFRLIWLVGSRFKPFYGLRRRSPTN